MKITPVVCGYPPRLCAHFSYSVPQYYIEVLGTKQSFFSGLPFASMQLESSNDTAPISSNEDEGNYSNHARTITHPFSSIVFGGLPCDDDTPMDNYCFSSMSEHLGSHWKTGEGDRNQPLYLAWSAAPKACLIKGAVTSVTGESRSSPYPTFGSCSFKRSGMTSFPPSTAPVCTAWGIHFPRYGTVNTADETTGSLVLASRIKSLGAEVFNSVESKSGQKWQMIYPHGTSCFNEGQNIGLLRLKNINEIGRLRSGQLKGHLYSIWKPVSCVKDIDSVATTLAWIAITKAACAASK